MAVRSTRTGRPVIWHAIVAVASLPSQPLSRFSSRERWGYHHSPEPYVDPFFLPYLVFSRRRNTFFFSYRNRFPYFSCWRACATIYLNIHIPHAFNLFRFLHLYSSGERHDVELEAVVIGSRMSHFAADLKKKSLTPQFLFFF